MLWKVIFLWDILTMKQYKHFISLGYFCSVASELERIGLRSTSSPFDWCISNYEGVIDAIENHFENFLNYDYLLQSDTECGHYFNPKYKIWFFHDFDKYRSLEEQLPSVKDKYLRRIERFYKNIQQPTLFVRYISDEIVNEYGKSKELDWIEKNNHHILLLLKSFNEYNDIIYIANDGVTSKVINIFNVQKDKNDVVARRPLDKNTSLNEFFMLFDYEPKEKNIDVFIKKQKKKNKIIQKIYMRACSYFRSKIFHKYIHDKIISHTTK